MADDSYQTWLNAIRKKLDLASVEAEPLVQAGKFDEAESLVRRVESDIYGAVALGTLFTRMLEQHVSQPNANKAHAKALFDRALRWRSAWPTVHTAEEAKDERANAEAVEVELATILHRLDISR